MKFIKTLLSIFLFVSFISCGSEEGNSLENCKEPKKVVHVEDVDGNFSDKCMLLRDCRGNITEGDNGYSCSYEDTFKCPEGQYHIVTEENVDKCVTTDNVNESKTQVCIDGEVYAGSKTRMPYAETCDEGCGEKGDCYQSEF